MSKTVATFIVQKILSDEVGLSYICATAERCYAVGTVLGGMVAARGAAERAFAEAHHSMLLEIKR